MIDHSEKAPVCIVGASHAGVTCAFALRSEGWTGPILLFDQDPNLPYQRPPMSKAFLSGDLSIADYSLKSEESYRKEGISLRLGQTVVGIDNDRKSLFMADGSRQTYEKLVLATGARPLIPPIEGLPDNPYVYSLRTAMDILSIREALRKGRKRKVVVIGGGYIGLETAASLRKLGAEVTLLEKEDRLLARVTSPILSDYFRDLHQRHGVHLEVRKQVIAVKNHYEHTLVCCADGTSYEADFVLVGTGIVVNTELAALAGLTLKDGIRVDERARTSDEVIYAIGDCTSHFNPHYGRYVRLESVQNAVDQAKVAAATICGKDPVYDAVPWFWSDQYDVKLQMVGLSQNYEETVIRRESTADCFSVWYFRQGKLLAVDAINCPKAFVVGTRLIRDRAYRD
jgi:3-phenylpropionate/trans-cinnamate dioxygenase ferredoxin reductase component